MLRYSFLIGSCLFCTIAFAQNKAATDSLSQIAEALPDAKDGIHTLDSTRQALQTKLDSISNLNLPTGKSDSLRQIWQSKLDKLNSPVPSPAHKLDSLQAHYQSKIDSLQSLNLPHEKYLAKLDSIIQLPEQKLSEKMTELQGKAEAKLGSLQNKIMDKTGLDIAEVEKEVPLENIDVPDPELSAIIEKADIEALDTQLELSPEIEGLDELKQELNLDQVQQELGEIWDLPTSEIEKAKEMAQVEDISSELNKVNTWGNKADEYTKQIQAMKEGDISGVEEQVASNLEEVASLKEQSSAFEQVKKEQEEYLKLQQDYLKQAQQYSDPEFVKQRIMEKSRHVANQKLVEYKSQLQEAQKELAVLKIDTGKALMEIPDAAEWPFRDRIIIGTNLELTRDQVTQLDLAPYVGLMLNDRWHVFGSYMYRFRFNNDRTQFQFNRPVHGPRIATTYRFFKGFYVRFSGEQIRTDVPAANPVDETTRKWIYGAYAGVGNRYNIANHLKGTIQVMYNFLHDEDSPYPKSFNIRLGFEVDLRKRITRKDTIEKLEKAGKRKRTLNSIVPGVR